MSGCWSAGSGGDFSAGAAEHGIQCRARLNRQGQSVAERRFAVLSFLEPILDVDLAQAGRHLLEYEIARLIRLGLQIERQTRRTIARLVKTVVAVLQAHGLVRL